MYTGIQMFGLMKGSQDDPEEVFKNIRAAGCSHIEPDIGNMSFPGSENLVWTPEKTRELLPKIHEAGLKVDSCHLFYLNPLEEADKLKALAKDCGIRKFVVKSPRELTEEKLQETAMVYMTLADALKEAGAELLVHNEAVDVSTKIGGTSAYEHLIDLCNGKVFMQPDLGWVYGGGEAPDKFLWRNKGRVRSIHYKDAVKTDNGFAEVLPGTGDIDLAACFRFARAFSLTNVIDVDSYSEDKWGDVQKVRTLLDNYKSTRPCSLSYLNILNTETGEVRTLKKFDGVIEAPNWLKTRDELFYNAEGRMYAFDLETNEERLLDTGSLTNVNNDHILSPDEKILAVSQMTVDRKSGFSSRVYSFSLEDGTETLLTPESPSFLHGWSPENDEIAYCAFRSSDAGNQVDIYVRKIGEDKETCLTSGGYNDGPEYSPDGKHIWFNTTRSGLMQVWRMNRDGSDQRQMTFTERNNWFPHISPDGQKVVWISYGKDDLEPGEHLPNFPMELWMMNADGSNPRRILSFFGGQGSINVNSWSADNKHIAFVSYEMTDSREA